MPRHRLQSSPAVIVLGTKGGKPITAIEKRQARMLREELRKREERRERKQGFGLIDPALVDKIARDIRGLDVVTPFILTQRYNLKYSIAKRVLLELANRGIVEIYSKTRRLIIALPKK